MISSNVAVKRVLLKNQNTSERKVRLVNVKYSLRYIKLESHIIRKTWVRAVLRVVPQCILNIKHEACLHEC